MFAARPVLLDNFCSCDTLYKTHFSCAHVLGGKALLNRNDQVKMQQNQPYKCNRSTEFKSNL